MSKKNENKKTEEKICCRLYRVKGYNEHRTHILEDNKDAKEIIEKENKNYYVAASNMHDALSIGVTYMSHVLSVERYNDSSTPLFIAYNVASEAVKVMDKRKKEIENKYGKCK